MAFYKIGGANIVTSENDTDIYPLIKAEETLSDNRPFVIKYLEIKCSQDNAIIINDGVGVPLTGGEVQKIENVLMTSIVVETADTIRVVYKY